MKRFLTALVCVLLPLAGWAQEPGQTPGQGPITGRVLDASTGEILPYVTVAVKGKDFGVISDREGRFELWGGGDLLPTDSVVFSHVGYDPQMRTVAGIAGGEHDIVLRLGEYEIEQIVVTNRRSRLAKLGHSSGGAGMLQGGWFTGRNYRVDSLGNRLNRMGEGGVPIRVRHDSEILSMGMRIRTNGYERALLRLQFYSIEDNTPGEQIVHRDIRFEITGRYKGWYELDLTPYDIRFPAGREVLITLTLLEDEMAEGITESFSLDAALLGRGVYNRYVGSEHWTRTGGVTMTMFLNARMYP